MVTVYASAFMTDLDINQNMRRHVMASTDVKRFFHTEIDNIDGVYKSGNELSLRFRVQESNLNNVTELFCGLYEQECIMVVTSENVAYLVSSDKVIGAPIGELVKLTPVEWVTEFDGETKPDHSYDGQYFYYVQGY